MAKKDKKKCKECQMRLIDYVQQSLCRECYERGAARAPGKGRHSHYSRPLDMQEDTRETKYGTGH